MKLRDNTYLFLSQSAFKILSSCWKENIHSVQEITCFVTAICGTFCSAIFHYSNPPKLLLLWRRSWRERVCTELTNEDDRSWRLTWGLANANAGGNVFIPAPFPVQGDCFGELSKVHWNHLSVFKRLLWNMTTPFEWCYPELGKRVIMWNCQRLFLSVNAVSLLSVKLHCWRYLFCC